MADKVVPILLQTLKPIKIIKWKVNEGNSVSIGCVFLLYEVDEDDKHVVCKLKSTQAGTVHKLLGTEGDVVKPGERLLELQACAHPTVMRDMCAECGADLRKDDAVTLASVPMVHSVPELKVSLEQAQKIGRADVDRLLKDRKLVLLVDLDQTLIHTTNDNIPANIKDVYHFQLYGPQSPWYHTRLRPGTHRFLENMSPYFELHICTFGARNYAHMIAMFLDQDGKLFSQRILSRDECFNPTSKTANLTALFPCGDDMVCIIDDREDVWSHAANLIHVKPYHFFQHTGDINAPPGLDKHEDDEKEGVDLTKVTSDKQKTVKANGLLNKENNDMENKNEENNDIENNIEENTVVESKVEEIKQAENKMKKINIENNSVETNNADNKMEENNSVEINDTETKMEENNSVETNNADNKMEENNSVETNDAENKIEENNSVESNNADNKMEENNFVETNDAENKIEENNSVETNNADNKMEENNFVETNDAENKIEQNNSVETNNADNKMEENNTVETNDAENKMEENNSVETNDVDNKMEENNDFKKKTAETKVAEIKPEENNAEKKINNTTDKIEDNNHVENENNKIEMEIDNQEIDLKHTEEKINEEPKFDNEDKESNKNKTKIENHDLILNNADEKIIQETKFNEENNKNKMEIGKQEVILNNAEEKIIKDKFDNENKENKNEIEIRKQEDNSSNTEEQNVQEVSKSDNENKENQPVEELKNENGQQKKSEEQIKVNKNDVDNTIETETTEEKIEENNVQNNFKSYSNNDNNETKDDELIEIEDPDDYLMYLEDILKIIHKTFYETYDKLEAGTVPDLKKVIPEVRRNVLKDTKLVFSGLVPTHIKLEQSKAYQVARSLGAIVTQDLEASTTHLVAVRPGTAKVNAGRRKRNLKIVTPDWLWACAERWTKIDEKLYNLNNKGSKNRHPPPHCSSPEHNVNFDEIQNPTLRKRTPSGRFMDTINPLMSFSSADIADMDREVEDIFNESESEGESSKKIVDADEAILLELKKDKESDDESSSSDESLTGEHPHGWRPDENSLKRSREDQDLEDDSTADEFPSTKFRRGEELSSDLDIGQGSNSEGSVDAPDEIDDGDWNMMGAALEREFLANN